MFSIFSFVLTMYNPIPDPTVVLIGMIKDIVVAISAVGTFVIAFVGLNIWKRQLTAKTKYKIARKFLESIYRVRDALQDFRHPFMEGHEIQEAIDEAQHLSDDQKNKLTHDEKIALTFNKRWKPVYDAKQAMSDSLYQSEVVWGKEVKEKINDFNQCYKNLYVAIKTYTMLSNESRTVDKKMYKDVQKIVFKMSDDPEKDNFTKKLLNSIETIEEYIGPYISL